MKLITAGCSFSELYHRNDTWPRHLQDYLNCDHLSLGLGSAGNGLISKKVIHAVAEEENKDNLLVGIMWSGPHRLETYIENGPLLDYLKEKNRDMWVINPVQFVEEDNNGAWAIHNMHWSNKLSQHYYRYYSIIEGSINTFEKILYTQLFLEKHHVNYFMMCYANETLCNKNHPSVNHLADQINWDTFVSEQGEYEWVKEHAPNEFISGDSHPCSKGHELYTQQIIIPYLKRKKLI